MEMIGKPHFMLSPFRRGLPMLFLLTASACIQQEPVTGPRTAGTVVGTQSGFSVAGGLVLEDGSKAPGAEVALYPGSLDVHQAGSSIQPVSRDTADSLGSYLFPNLDSGIYSIRALYSPAGARDTLAAGRSGIRIFRSENLGTDTLRQPGEIRGQVMVNGKPLFGALIFLAGTSYLAISDTSGFFRVLSVAAGTYSVSYRSKDYLTTSVSPVQVVPGKATHLGAVELVPDPSALPLPPPDFKGVYDTLSGVATLTWTRSSSARTLGYFVYKGDASPSRLKLLTETAIDDTLFEDTLYRESRSPGRMDLVYAVSALGSNRNESPFQQPAYLTAFPPPGFFNPRPGNGSEAADTAFTLRWDFFPATGIAADGFEVRMDTVSPPLASQGRIDRGDSLQVRGLSPGGRYHWKVVARFGDRTVESKEWRFATRDILPAPDSLDFVEIAGGTGHIRLDGRIGACRSCAKGLVFSNPLRVTYGRTGRTLVVQVYKNGHVVPVFPKEDPNAGSPSGVSFSLEPGDHTYEFKIWAGEQTPRQAFFFTVGE